MLTILLIELYKTQLSWFLLFQRMKHTYTIVTKQNQSDANNIFLLNN